MIKKTVTFSYSVNVEIQDHEIVGKTEQQIDDLAICKADVEYSEISPKVKEMNIDVEDGE